jgi:hypothetical protein
MSVYLGVDFHARTQTVCWCDISDRLVHQRVLDHQRDEVRDFYAQFPAPAVVGLDATDAAPHVCPNPLLTPAPASQMRVLTFS